MVNGLTISSLEEYDCVCEGCVLGKSHRLPFPKASLTNYTPMELIVVDLTGPMSVEMWSGMSYMFIAVEMNSQMSSGELLASKDKVAETLKTIIVKLEHQSSIKTKWIRSDNVTEFVNSVVYAFCKWNGILHETTIPYMPEQSGVAKRAIKTHFEMVRCMLHSAQMDLRYWGKAFLYAVYIRNHSPTSAILDKVPMHVWTSRKPDVSPLRVFGSIAYANILKKVRQGKLEVTSVKCRLLGWWANESKGYRLEDIEMCLLIASCDVRFVEDNTSSDLAVIEDGLSGIHKDLNVLSLDEPYQPTSTMPNSPASTTSDFESKGCFEPAPPPPLPIYRNTRMRPAQNVQMGRTATT
jgi:hypothetical protein